jgi:hypothetical protein
MTVRIEGLDAAIATVTATLNIKERVLDDMAAVAYEGMRQGAGRHSPRPGGTGNLYRSLYSKLIPNGREVGHDTRQAPYAEWVIGGSVPHIIVPKNAKALRWFAWSGGPPVFAKRVKHPGYIGDNYLGRAADDSIAALAGIVDRTLKEVT